MSLEQYYKVASEDMVAVANKIRTKGGTQAALEWPDDWKDAIDAIEGGGGESIKGLNLLKPIIEKQDPPQINPYWVLNTGSGGNGTITSEEATITSNPSATTAAWSTSKPYDFSNYSKLVLKVKSVTGQYTEQCRFSVSSQGQITNGNRGDYYINLSATQTETEFELTLPQNRSSLYVGVLAWTNSTVVFTEIRAE